MIDFSHRSNRWIVGGLLALIVALSSVLFVELIYPGEVLERVQLPFIPQQLLTPEQEFNQLEQQLDAEQTNLDQEAQKLDEELLNIDQELQGLP